MRLALLPSSVALLTPMLLPIPLPAQAAAAPAARRPLVAEDLYRLRDVRDPQRSPDGAWVAYVVSSPDRKRDRNDADIWMTSWDGARTVRLTTSEKSETTPRWSPDGRWLGFLSARADEEKGAQLWLIDRAGGEGERVTSLPGGVTYYAWAPDGKRVVLVADDADPPPKRDTTGAAAGATTDDTAAARTPPPIVIDRYHFKRDETGYLGAKRSHLYVLDLVTRTTVPLTTGPYDEYLPSWSPDGRSVAFVSRRREEFDRTSNWDVYVVEARAGAEPRQLTTFEGPDADPDWESAPQWSPDGRSIAYVQGGPERLIYYAGRKLAVIPAAGGTPRILTADLDRNADAPRWTADGQAILFLLEDDRAQHVARVRASGGRVERVVAGRRVVNAFSPGRDGKLAILVTTPQAPNEVHAVDRAGAEPRPLSRQNDGWLAGVRLGAVEEVTFPSRDGTTIGGLIVTASDRAPGQRLPTILRIHGGPVSQFGAAFDFAMQYFAARGYAVVAANPRGSSGRGEAFSTAIYADWGNKDAQDVLAAVDHAVARGIADAERLGVGGWSYGGILTNYVIAQDTRFKAAVSGAGISNVLAGYGTDQYIREYREELGEPWQKPELWTKLSSPFLHADRIVTPTLFMCGEKDFNVPLLNSEQMYQALRSLGRETQLVIYPGEYHDIRKPSYRRDRLERYVQWYDRFLKPATSAAAGAR
ncbi:MAG TPA: S9 family peptidase [Gemmatimonadaceae bacterium]|nr:S9 family peptidase [Gemmatimonadaceae bacterium]